MAKTQTLASHEVQQDHEKELDPSEGFINYPEVDEPRVLIPHSL